MNIVIDAVIMLKVNILLLILKNSSTSGEGNGLGGRFWISFTKCFVIIYKTKKTEKRREMLPWISQ
jgi:hypothetical protein